MNPLTIVATMARRGMLTPALPHRTLGQVVSLATWGMSLVGEVRQATKLAPNQAAVIDEARGAVTYAELFDRSMRAAVALRRRGLTAGQRVGLLARNHVGAVEVMVGASAAEVDLVLVNTGLAGEQLALVAAQQDLALLVHDEEFTEAVQVLAGAVETVSENDFAADIDAVPVGEEVGRPQQAGRTIILTSGTTGVPKGAARRTPGGVGPLVSMIDRIPLHAGDRILVSAPIFHTWGFAALQLAFGLHATVVLRRRFTPADASATLAEHDCHAMFAVPVMLQRMIEQLPPDPDARARRRSLRVVATSGSAYPSGFTTRFMDEYGDVLYNLYGSTEASWVCIATPRDLRRHPDCAGRPPLGTVVRILDEDGQDVAPGATGRIFCGSDMVFEGYTSGPGKEFVDGMVCTGDMGHVADGVLFVDGRDDDMVISGGENVYPYEVESLLIDHPAIREVSVVGVPDPEFGQRLAAFIALEDGQSLTADDVRDLVRSQRARHCVPREVVFLDELPRNATGKVLTRDLRARFS